MNLSILKKVSKKLNNSVKETPALIKQIEDSVMKDDVHHLVNEKGLVVDGLDLDLLKETLQNRLPVDAWGCKQWYLLWKQVYSDVFKKPCLIKRQHFNTVFATFLYEARDKFGLSNSEIRNYIFWFSKTYMEYLKKYEKPFNFGSLKFRLGDYCNQVISSVEKRESICGKRLRDVIIDPGNLKASIDENYQENVGLLVKQLGFPIMLYYNLKFVHNDTEESLHSLIASVSDRMKFQIETEEHGERKYISEICYNSIYFGPYPFEEKNKFKNYVSWREVFKKRINVFELNKEPWYIGIDLNREPIVAVKNFSKKRRIVKKTNAIIITTEPEL